MISRTLLFATVSSGTSIVLSHIYGATGNPRIFEGQQGFYLYGLNVSLLRSPSGDTFTEAGHTHTVRAMTEDSSTIGQVKIVTFEVSPSQVVQNYYQTEPVVSGGWLADGTLPSGFLASDAISITDESILTGNAHAGSEPRIERSAQAAPYSFSQSDTGLSSTLITDLES